MDDDFSVWQSLIKDVKKIDNKTRCPPGSKNKAVLPNVIEKEFTDFSFITSKFYNHLDVSGKNKTSLDRNTTLRINQGKYPIEAVIDLHGCTLNDAFHKLSRFILSSFDSKYRLILIIVGWGKVTGESAIRKEIRNWLDGPTLQNMILYYKQALPKHGGNGALYVLLKKRKHNTLD